jgi:hypothetical protein
LTNMTFLDREVTDNGAATNCDLEGVAKPVGLLSSLGLLGSLSQNLFGDRNKEKWR